MQEKQIGEQIQTRLSVLARSNNRARLCLGALDALSFNPDFSKGADILATARFVREHVREGATTKPPYVPIPEGTPRSMSPEAFFSYLRSKAKVEENADIEDLRDLDVTDSLLMIAAAVVSERNLRLGPEDYQTFQNIYSSLEETYSSDDEEK